MLIGYARVSTDDQNLDLQLDALQQVGCDKIYEDRISDTKAARPGLALVLEVARSGDVLVVWRLDRLGRSLHDLIVLAKQLDAAGIGIKSLQESIDTTTSGGRLVPHHQGDARDALSFPPAAERGRGEPLAATAPAQLQPPAAPQRAPLPSGRLACQPAAGRPSRDVFMGAILPLRPRARTTQGRHRRARVGGGHRLRSGPYHPISGPIPLHRYRAFKKTVVDEKADRIRQLADQLGLPITALAGESDICITVPAMPSNVPHQPFDAEALENRYSTIIAAKLAIADEIATPLAKLSPDDRAFIDGVLAKTMTCSVVLARVREYFRRKRTEGDGHAG